MLKILIVFLALPQLAFCGDFSEWFRATPGGNTISYEALSNDQSVMIHCGRMYDAGKDYQRVIDHIERWYFYKDFVVGNYWENGVREYFVFNELTCQCQTFSDWEAFEKQKRELGIKPIIWTRWYSKFWGVITGEGDFGTPFDRLPLSLLIWCLIIITPIQLIMSRFSPKSRLNQILLLAFCSIAFRLWLDIHPQSF